MRLIELEPRWVVQGPGERHGMGLSFDCPHCGTQRLSIMFANPIDGGAPSSIPGHLWQRTGEDFDTLSIAPSIDASGASVPSHMTSEFEGHWHGHITNGGVS